MWILKTSYSPLSIRFLSNRTASCEFLAHKDWESFPFDCVTPSRSVDFHAKEHRFSTAAQVWIPLSLRIGLFDLGPQFPLSVKWGYELCSPESLQRLKEGVNMKTSDQLSTGPTPHRYLIVRVWFCFFKICLTVCLFLAVLGVLCCEAFL